MADLQTMLARFGFVTVMKPTFYEVGSDAPLFTIDSLRISNITQEGPSKTVKGGLYANTQMRYGKTMRLEMEDVVGRIDVLKRLMGARVVDGEVSEEGDKITVEFTAVAGQKEFPLAQTAHATPAAEIVGGEGTVVANLLTLTTAAEAGDKIVVTYRPARTASAVQVTDKFAPAVKIIGQTFVIDSVTGNKQWVKIHIPKFLPDSVFTQTMEAEGDFGAMNIAGDILADDCGIFYEFLVGDAETSCK